MNLAQKVALASCLIVAPRLGVATTAQADPVVLNSVGLSTPEVDDDPTSDFTAVNSYRGLVSFGDRSVDGDGQPGGFANATFGGSRATAGRPPSGSATTRSSPSR